MLKARLEREPALIADYVISRIKAGQSVDRGVMLMLEAVYDDAQTQRVEKPSTLDELAKLSRDERKALLARLEEESGTEPFNAEAYRESLRCPHCGRSRAEPSL